MSIKAEAERLAAVDPGAGFKALAGGTRAITGGLAAMGLLNEGQMRALQTASGALSVMTGMIGIATAARAIKEAKTAKEEVKAAALTAAKTAEIGIGWTEIAIATAAATAAGIGMYAAVNNMHIGPLDLSTAEGQAQASQAAASAAGVR